MSLAIRRLDSRDAALKGGDEGAVIVPGKSQESLLVVAVAQLDDETAMPPKRNRGGFGFGGSAGVAHEETAKAIRELGGIPGTPVPGPPGRRSERNQDDPQDGDRN